MCRLLFRDWIVAIFFFCSSSLLQALTIYGTAGERKGPFFDLLPFPPAHKYPGIYLKLCMLDDYHVFLIALLITTRLIIHETCQVFQLPLDRLMVKF